MPADIFFFKIIKFLLINDSQYIFLNFSTFDVNNSNIHFAKLIQAQVSSLLAQLNRKNRFVFGIEIDNCFMRLYIIYNSLGQILSVWYYHVSVILCITQTWYFISGKFLTLKKVSVRCALFRTLLNNTFPEQCIISKIVFPLKNGSITSVWYYHVCVIL